MKTTKKFHIDHMVTIITNGNDNLNLSPGAFSRGVKVSRCNFMIAKSFTANVSANLFQSQPRSGKGKRICAKN